MINAKYWPNARIKPGLVLLVALDSFFAYSHNRKNYFFTRRPFLMGAWMGVAASMFCQPSFVLTLALTQDVLFN